MNDNKKTILVGVTGGSCSGKSWLCDRIKLLLPESECAIVSLDSYYKDISSLLEDDREKQNFDVPDALDKNLLERHLYSLAKGSPIEIPVYDFSSHTRSIEKKRVDPSGKIILVEGLFTLYWESIRRLFATKIFVDFDEERRLSRRLVRDVEERGRGIEAIENQYKSMVAPMYKMYIEPTRIYADILVEGNLKDREITQNILRKIPRI